MKTRQYNGGAGRSLTLAWAIPAEALQDVAEALQDVRECPSGGGIPSTLATHHVRCAWWP